MNAPPLPDLAGLYRDANALADRIKLIQLARCASQDASANPQERADAYHVLSVHEPGLHDAARNLAAQLDVLRNTGRGEYVSVPRYWRERS